MGYGSEGRREEGERVGNGTYSGVCEGGREGVWVRGAREMGVGWCGCKRVCSSGNAGSEH